MKFRLIIILFILISGFISCQDNNNVTYEYGANRGIGKLFYEDKSDTIIYDKSTFFNIKYKLSQDTCYAYDQNDSLLSTSISLSNYLDPDYIYVLFLSINRLSDSLGNLELAIEENNVKRNLKFGNNLVIGPFPNFKVKKEESYFKLFCKEIEYKINIDSDYAFLLLSIDNKNCLKCSYRNDLPLMR